MIYEKIAKIIEEVTTKKIENLKKEKDKESDYIIKMYYEGQIIQLEMLDVILRNKIFHEDVKETLKERTCDC